MKKAARRITFVKNVSLGFDLKFLTFTMVTIYYNDNIK
jgi:hypothetical protein